MKTDIKSAKYIFHSTALPRDINIAIGPYYTRFLSVIGNKKIYCREDIEKFAALLSKTLSNRVLNLRPGNDVLISHTSRTHNLTLKRLTEGEIKVLEEIESLTDESKRIWLEIQSRCPDLIDLKSEVDSKIRKLKNIASIKL